MTKEEALKIPDLQVDVDGLTEDWFYLLMMTKDKVSKEMGEKALERIKLGDEVESADALLKAEQMKHNLEKYGVPCAAWVK